MKPLWLVLIGAGITLLLVFAFTPVIVHLAEKSARQRLDDHHVTRKWWRCSPLGLVEGLVLYGSFVTNSPALAVAWLVFKTAAKWKTWDSTEKLAEHPNKTVGAIAARYEAFLAGTGANIVFALVGAGLASAIK